MKTEAGRQQSRQGHADAPHAGGGDHRGHQGTAGTLEHAAGHEARGIEITASATIP